MDHPTFDILPLPPIDVAKYGAQDVPENKERYSKALLRQDKHSDERAKEHQKIYHWLIGMCTEDVIARLMKEADWEVARTNKDPSIFCKLASRVLSTAFTDLDVNNVSSAVDAWTNLKQGNRSLVEFFENAEHVYKHGKTLKALTLDEKYYAWQFLLKSNPLNYTDLIRDIKHGLRQPPSTLREAYEMMYNYNPPGNPVPRESSASDVIMVSHHVGSDKKRKRKTGETTEGANREIVVCYYCGNKGHTLRDCLIKKKGKAARKRAFGGDNNNEDSCYLDQYRIDPSASTAAFVNTSGSADISLPNIPSLHNISALSNTHIVTPMEISINFDFVQSAGERPFQPFEVGGDTMASVHIIKDRELLSNLRRADQPITVVGLAGKQTASIIGDFGPFQSPAWYIPEAPCNIVSLGRAVADGAVREYDSY